MQCRSAVAPFWLPSCAELFESNSISVRQSQSSNMITYVVFECSMSPPNAPFGGAPASSRVDPLGGAVALPCLPHRIEAGCTQATSMKPMKWGSRPASIPAAQRELSSDRRKCDYVPFYNGLFNKRPKLANAPTENQTLWDCNVGLQSCAEFLCHTNLTLHVDTTYNRILNFSSDQYLQNC